MTDTKHDIYCWPFRLINNVYKAVLHSSSVCFCVCSCNNTLVVVTHIQERCRLQSYSCVDTQGDTPCRSYSHSSPVALCKINNKADRLTAGAPHFKQLHVKWNSRSFFWGHKLNCKHVEIQCLTERCKDKQMWVNVPFQLQCLSYIYWRFNFKIPWIVFGLRIALITNLQTHLMS